MYQVVCWIFNVVVTSLWMMHLQMQLTLNAINQWKTWIGISNELYSPISIWCKIALLTNKTWLEVICVSVLFLDCLHQFDFLKTHMMLVIMFDHKFKYLSILNNYVGIKKTTIAIKRYDLKIPAPFFCSTYQKVHPSTKHPYFMQFYYCNLTSHVCIIPLDLSLWNYSK